MADEPQHPLQVEVIPSVVGSVSAIARAQAPFIYVDVVPNFGIRDGIVSMTLEALRHSSVNGAVLTDRVIVGHLRLSIPAFGQLNSAVKGVEILLAKVDEKQIN